MARLRRVLRNPVIVAVASRLAAGYIRLVWHTGSWRLDGEEAVHDLVSEGRTFIGCFWHGRMLMIPNAWRYGAPMSILISHHPDGVFISRTLRHLGIGTIAGSTSRGGTGALRGIVRALQQGGYVGITPDGPRGPRMHAARGAVMAARLSGAPILPLSFSASRRRVLSSWDRFMLPLPFSRGIIRIGKPFEVAADAGAEGIEAARQRLESELNRLTRELDSELGVETVEPAADPGARPLQAAGDTK